MLSRRFFSVGTLLLHTTKASLRIVPRPNSTIPDVSTFLKTIGRKCDEVLDVYGNTWENLFAWDSKMLKEKGVSVQQRKYILYQVEKLRKGEEVTEIKKGKKSFFGSERHRKENIAKWRAEQRNL